MSRNAPSRPPGARRPLLALALVATAGTLLSGPAAHAAAGNSAKVASIVQQVADRAAADHRAGRSAAHLSGQVVKVGSDGAIEVGVWATGQAGARERADLTRLGARHIASASKGARRGRPAYAVFHVALPHDRIDDAAALDWVGAITSPGYGYADDHPTNPVNSQGVALHNADDVQSRGIDGTGVTVGVISTGVPNLAAGDLPAVTVNNAGCTGSAACDEGTAMLEIVHDMAPGAGLMFDAGTGAAKPGHIAAQDWLAANGADVITEDLAFDDEPAFEYGAIAANGDEIAAGGVPMHSSAGNLGDAHSERVIATGTGQGPDGGTGPCAGGEPDNAVAVAGGGDTTFDISVPAMTPPIRGTLTLQWSEPRAIAPPVGRGGFTNLDLYVLDAAGTTCVMQSNGAQGLGVGDTIEQIQNLPAGNYKVVVDVENAPAGVAVPTLDLRMRNVNATDTPTRAGSVNPDSNYTGLATSAAALNSQAAGALEGFSAGGPVRLLTTTQCPADDPAPCGTGVAGTLSQTVSAPTWAGADNVAVTGAGGFSNPFSGTSAAAPHAAGCDALLRDELNQPDAAPAVTNARLKATALDIAPAGVDDETGAGRLDCLQAVNDPPVADAGGPYATQEGANVTLDGSGSSDPDTGDTLTYRWDLDDDGSFDDAFVASPTFSRVGRDGQFTVRLRVTDTADATSTDSASVTVANVAPAMSAITAGSPKAENTAMSISGTISDPGWQDPLSLTIDPGDGTGPRAVAAAERDEEHVRPDGSIAYSVSHAYGDDGSFTVRVCGADDDVADICVTKQVAVTNVAPTASIDGGGAIVINGVPIVLANAGAAVDVSGRSTDPGSDDLTLRWNWDDGPPVIDASTTYLVNPPVADPDPSPTVQPRDVTDAQAHAFAQACTYDIAFSALDDDGGVSPPSTLKVLVTGNNGKGQPSGYWAHQYRGKGAIAFDTVTLNCYLEIVDLVSRVFHQVRDAATPKKAQALLFSQGTSVSKWDQFDRDLLTALLNFANGAVQWDEAVDTNADGVADRRFGDAVLAAETLRLDAGATAAQIDAQRARLQSINDTI